MLTKSPMSSQICCQLQTLSPQMEEDSLEQVQIHSESTRQETFCEKFRRKFSRVWKSVLACFVMLTVGIVLICLPTLFPSLSDNATGLYIAGSLLLIPSGYIVYVMYNVFRDRYGFNLDHLDMFQEQLV